MSEASPPVGTVAGTHERLLVEGPGAAGFLQGLVSQDIEALEPGRAARSFLLSPQGKLRALLWLHRRDERIWITTDVGYGARVGDDLRHYKIRVKAEIGGPAPVWQVIGAETPGVVGPLAGATRVFADEPPPGLPPLDPEVWTALRIEAGEPVMGVDVDERTIPQETGLVPAAVSFEKGCYLGQELVARIDTRGRVNRHLRGLLLEEQVPAPAPVTRQGEEAGVMTSSASSPWMGRWVGLAMLHRSVEPGQAVEVAGVKSLVDELPLRNVRA
jgi:folate-binding protein YgfZ